MFTWAFIVKKPNIKTIKSNVRNWGSIFLNFILRDTIKKGLDKSSPFYQFTTINYLDGGTYKIPPLVHNSFGPLSGKIPVSAIFLL
jgi:hypothetical protein